MQAGKKLSYTPEQKVEIMALAKKYDLDITLKYNFDSKDFQSVEEVEKEFQEIHLAMSTPQKLICDKNGVMRSVRMRGMSKASPSTESSSGSWSGDAKSVDSRYTISCEVSWTTGTPTSPSSCTVTSGFSDRDYPTTTYNQTGSTHLFTGASSLSFTFNGTWQRGNLSGKVYGNGSVDTQSKNGTIIFGSVS